MVDIDMYKKQIGFVQFQNQSHGTDIPIGTDTVH